MTESINSNEYFEDNDFSKIRRNVVLISFISIMYIFLNVKIDELSILGIKINITVFQVRVLICLIWMYSSFRYMTYYSRIHDDVS